MIVVTMAAMVPDYQITPSVPPTDGVVDRAVISVLLVGAGLMLLAAVVSLLIHRDRRRGGAAFRVLSRAMGIRFDQRLLVYRVARMAGGIHPASLLISRGCFEAAVGGYVDRFGEAGRLQEIRRRVFREDEKGDRSISRGIGGKQSRPRRRK